MAVSTIAILTRCWTWKYCPRIRRTFASSIMRNSGCVASSPAGTVTDAQPARGRAAGARSSPERTTDGKRFAILRVFVVDRAQSLPRRREGAKNSVALSQYNPSVCGGTWWPERLATNSTNCFSVMVLYIKKICRNADQRNPPENAFPLAGWIVHDVDDGSSECEPRHNSGNRT